MVIKGYRVGPLLKKTFSEIGDDNVGSLAASAAYNFFFSLFPLLLFLTPLLTLVVNKQRTVTWIVAQLSSVLPAEQVQAFRPVLDKVVFSESAPGLMSIGLVLAAWSGSNIFGTLMSSLNDAYDVKETRSWVRQQVLRLITLALGSVIVILSTIILLDGEGVANLIGRTIGLGAIAVWTWKILQFPLAILGLFGLAFVTYTLLPNVKQRRAHRLVASALTTALWIVATLVFRIYISHFPPNPAYGIIGGVIILLTWMYYTMFVVLVGGELASELHHGTGAIDPDRGAVYVGRIVTGTAPGRPSIEQG